MKGKWRAVVCSLVILLVTVCLAGFALAADQGEPTYQGRTLSDWTHDFDSHGLWVAGYEPPAQIAISHIGTNAIPTLLKWMSEPDPPEPLKTNVPPCFNTARSWRAGVAFSILGEAARPAIPELARLARTWSDQKRAMGCVDCLACIGPEAIPSLLSLATNAPPHTRWCAFHGLDRFTDSPAKMAIVPVLIKWLGDEREDVVDGAVELLCEFHLPDVVVPALTNALQSSSRLTRLFAVRGLGWQEEPPVSVIPLLRAAMRDPDYRVRESATEALRSLGGWQLEEGRWFRIHNTDAVNGITPDFFTDGPSAKEQR